MTTTSKVYNVDGDVVIVLPKLSDYCRCKIASMLESGFTWGSTQEGYEYWSHVKEALGHGDYDDVPSNTAAPDDKDMVTFRWTGGGNKVSAIKLWRVLTSEGLKESKDAVERGDTLRINLYEARARLITAYSGDEDVWVNELARAGMEHDTRIFRS